MTVEKFSIKRALQRKPHVEPTPYAVLRMPTATEEFVAHWPSNVTASDLQTMKHFFGACMDGWIVNATTRAELVEQDAKAEAEYTSWDFRAAAATATQGKGNP